MKSRPKLTTTLAVLAWGAAVAVFGTSAAFAADVTEGCDNCHGKDGVSKESHVPTIAGMSAAYIGDSMKSYKKKDRPCVEAKYESGPKKGQKTDMCKVAADLSDADAKSAAKHYSGLKYVKAKQPFDAAKAKRGKAVHDTECVKCHDKGGTVADDDAGFLGGQWTAYLKEQLKYYHAGKRPQEEKMKAKIDKLGKDDEEALLHYYASVQ